METVKVQAVTDQMNESVNHLFAFAQDLFGATSGDISPEQEFELEEIKDKLMNLIVKVAVQNR